MSWMHKRRSYNIVRIEDSTWNWCYSALELQELLNELCRGQKLLRWMAELVGYAEATPRGANFLDLSYMGGNTLLNPHLSQRLQPHRFRDYRNQENQHLKEGGKRYEGQI